MGKHTPRHTHSSQTADQLSPWFLSKTLQLHFDGRMFESISMVRNCPSLIGFGGICLLRPIEARGLRLGFI